ncbi:MAG TPA: ATP-binding protein, partial [Thermodesulfovibrionales bacterium]|nr:ATP-binding protein [Thermodesulfovibrionales bacterium]
IAPYKTEKEILHLFKSASSIGRQDLSREIAGEKLERPEINQIIELLKNSEKSILLTDRPGSGKSWILLELADIVERNHQWSVLFIKGDRYDDICTEAELRQELGLSENIVGLAARLAFYRKVIIIIDSLDALSLGRDQKALKAFLALIDRLQSVEGISLVVACRDFDLSYDPLLRDRKWGKKITIADLDFRLVIAPILKKWGINPDSISEIQQKLLTIPRNLKMLERLVGKVPLESLPSTYHFLNSFIEEVVVKDPNLGKPALLALQDMASTLLKNRSLFMHKDCFKGDEEICRRLISAEVLLADTHRNRLAFYHQTLLDILITRDTVAKDGTLEEFILRNPPLPFIRPSVRAFLFYLRAHAPELFLRQVKKALENDNIAYHLRRLIAESLAEIQPTSADLPLFHWLLEHHADLFRRFFWSIKGPIWFDLFASDLFNKFLKDYSYNYLKLDFLLKLREWMNIYPEETIAYWKEAIDDDYNLIPQLLLTIENFEHWKAKGGRSLVETLLRKSPNDHEFGLGKIVSKYVDRTDDGDDLLWHYITINVPEDKLDRGFFHRHDGGLQCDRHEFHKESFFSKRVCKSSYLLDRCLEAVEHWSRSLFSQPDDSFRNAFLNDTSWVLTHSRDDIRHLSPLSELLNSMEFSLKERSKINDNWWKANESLLRQTSEASIAYMFIRAYQVNVIDNIKGITEFLKRDEILEYGSLSFEIGKLMRDSFPYLPPDFQEELQLKILNHLCSGHLTEENEKWVFDRRFKYLCLIPIIFRLPEVQSFIEKWQDEFGLAPNTPDIYSWGGTVVSPISVEDMNSLSDGAILKLIKFYDESKNRWESCEELIGGTDSIISTFRNCCAKDPMRFLPFIEKVYEQGILKEYAISVFKGVTDHLEYRFGNTQPPNEWKPVEPLPDGHHLALSLLMCLSKYTDFWNNGYVVARALEICCHILEESEEIEWLLLFLSRLANHSNPEELKQVIFSNNKAGMTSDDLMYGALNSVRGIAANGAIELANRLLTKGEKLPELLIPLLFRFAKDPVAAVRVSILMKLPLLTHYDNNLGWNILDAVFKDPHPFLWPHGERFLYYQYHNHFDRVQPYLDRIKSEAIETAGETWGMISTLAYLSGHITKDQLFNDLTDLNNKGAWLGAAQVFSANIEGQHRDVCEEGILQILKDEEIYSEVLSRIDTAFEHLSTGGAERTIEIAERFICAHDAKQLGRLHWFYDWLPLLANNSPRSALTVCEKLIDKIDGSGQRCYIGHQEGLVSAVIRILREADEDEMDDLTFIRRAIDLQDRLMRLNLVDILQVLEEAGRE